MGVQVGVLFIVQAAEGVAAGKSGLSASPLAFFPKIIRFVTFSNLLLLSTTNGISAPVLRTP